MNMNMDDVESWLLWNCGGPKTVAKDIWNGGQVSPTYFPSLRARGRRNLEKTGRQSSVTSHVTFSPEAFIQGSQVIQLFYVSSGKGVEQKMNKKSRTKTALHRYGYYIYGVYIIHCYLVTNECW